MITGHGVGAQPGTESLTSLTVHVHVGPIAQSIT